MDLPEEVACRAFHEEAGILQCHKLEYRMRLCAITDRKSMVAATGDFLPPEADPDQQLLHLVSGWVRGGVDLIQLREKDLDAFALRRLAEKILAGTSRSGCRFLVNLPLASPALSEIARVADGIHLPGRPEQGAVDAVRRAFQAVGREAIVSLSCHTVEEVRTAREERADMVLFAPVFEKPLEKPLEKTPIELPRPQGYPITIPGLGIPGQGLGALRRACEAAEEMPVYALGGVTVENAAHCEAAGAAGVAGIRLFAEDGWRSLRPASSTGQPALPFRAAGSTDI